MDKQTLSNYGWVIITVLVLAVMIALATPFGTYVKEGAKSTLIGLFESSENALNTGLGETGVTVNKAEFGETPTVDGNTGSASADGLNHSGIIPEGGRYVTNALLSAGATSQTGCNYNYTNSTTLTAGNPFPEAPQSGDIYYYGNYAYIFNGMMGNHCEPYDEYQAEYDNIDGWCVTSMMYGGTNPGEILSSVAGKNIKSLRYCFYNNAGSCQVEVLPQIPATVTDISCFLGSNGCSTLRTYAGSTDPDGDFSNYKIPDGVTDISSLFNSCSSLIAAPKIPNSVTSMNGTFKGCTSLTVAPEISNSVTNMGGTFNGCTSLTVAPKIPNSTTFMNGTFSGCTSLTTAPAIPNSVTSMYSTFYDCVNLTGTITINANPTSYNNCFGLSKNGKPITLTGSSTMLQTLANTNNNSYRTITIQ